MPDDIRDRARAEAERRWDERRHLLDSWGAVAMQAAFKQGAEWGHAQPRTVTPAEVWDAARAAWEAGPHSESIPWDMLGRVAQDEVIAEQTAAFEAVGITVEEGP